MPPAPPSADLLPGLTARLVVILSGLAALIARAFLRHPIHAVHIVPLWHYIGRTSRRFQDLAGRVAAGPLRPHAPRPNRKPNRQPANKPAPRGFPTTRAWLVTALRHEAVAYGSQLTHLLEQPEARAFLQSAPQAARLLRPICHMLGFMPEPLRLPRRTRTRRPAQASSPHQAPTPVSPAPRAKRPGASAPLWSPTFASPRQQLPPAPPPPEPCPRLLHRWPFNQFPTAHPA